MNVLPPVPRCHSEMSGFFREIAHIVNAQKAKFIARTRDRDVIVRSCFIKTTEKGDDWELCIYGVDDADTPYWHEKLSSIVITDFRDVFWLELLAENQAPLVLLKAK